MNNSIFIPKKIKVGFQERTDTYTKRLAYVIYYDQKDKLRKEASWQSWRDKNIDPEEYENIPTDGFVLNKKVGGYASHWGDFRQSYVRVYDPRGFEFEITIPNLLYILEHTSSIKGKGLEGEFVYGWNGTDLVLIPTCSPDYKELTALNEKRFANQTIKARDLQIGATYLTTTNHQAIYMGKFDEYGYGYIFDGKDFATYGRMQKYAEKTNLKLYDKISRKDRYRHMDGVNKGKQFYFYFREHSGCSSHFETRSSISGWLIDTVSADPAPDYAEIFEKLEASTIYSPYDQSKDVFVKMTLEEFLEEARNIGYWGSTFLTDTDGAYMNVEIRKYPSNTDPVGFVCNIPNDRYSIVGNFPVRDINTPGVYPWKNRKEMIPVSLEEIYEKLPLYYREQYLANGKFYRRIHSL